jgi:hypothetical protein
MRFELKSIVFSERMSEETNAFVANLYVDGKSYVQEMMDKVVTLLLC